MSLAHYGNRLPTMAMPNSTPNRSVMWWNPRGEKKTLQARLEGLSQGQTGKGKEKRKRKRKVDVPDKLWHR